MTVLVTGATGTTGRRVADRLDAAGAPVRRVSRSSPDRFDWADPSTHDPAFDGVDRLYLIAPVGVADPARLVRPVLDRAVARGLRRVVLLWSSAVDRGTEGFGALHDLVLSAAPEPVVLGASWFTQNFVGDHPAARGLRSGRLVSATGDGRVPFVDAGDIAAVAVAALLDERPPETELLVTGPEALSYADVCRIWIDVTGRACEHVTVSVDELAARLVADGTTPGFASVLAGLDDVVRSGAQARVSDVVERVTGRRARSVREVLTAAAGRCGSLRP